MSTRDDLLAIIGYQAETCLPDERPVTAYYTSRYLDPVLAGLVEYVESVRADERERLLKAAERVDDLHGPTAGHYMDVMQWRYKIFALLRGEQS